MPLEPPLAPKAGATLSAPPIENEIPTYRAISPLAVVAAVLGAASALSFTAYPWEAAAILAVVTGFVADRSIKKRPDALTGRSFAQAGIAMGLIFGISSFAHVRWTDYALRQDARHFAGEIIKTLDAIRTRDPVEVSDVTWFMIPPAARRGMSPGESKTRMAKVFKESELAKDIDDQIRRMCARAGKTKPFTINRIESAEYIVMSGYVAIILNVPKDDDHAHDHGKAAAPEPPGAENVMIYLQQVDDESKQKWFMKHLFYPYVPNTYKPEPQAPDDGHGH